MAETGKDQDQSMEDILQSIKRIIAEEGEPATVAPTGSDVLELTEMLAEDEQAASTVPTMSLDEIMAMPASTPMPEPVAEAAPAPAPAPEATPAPTIAVPASEPTPMAKPMKMDEDTLISDETRQASSAALDALRDIPSSTTPYISTSSAAFRSGNTVEDLVLEALRPMLKEWLDGNLTAMVKQLVEKEIRKLSSH